MKKSFSWVFKCSHCLTVAIEQGDCELLHKALAEIKIEPEDVDEIRKALTNLAEDYGMKVKIRDD